MAKRGVGGQWAFGEKKWWVAGARCFRSWSSLLVLVGGFIRCGGFKKKDARRGKTMKVGLVQRNCNSHIQGL